MRTVVGYIPSGYLNSAASPTSTGSQEGTTGLPIATGLGVGQIIEIGDGDAKGWSNPNTTTYVNQLYSGTFMWVQLDPAVTGGAIAVGSVVYFLESATGIQVTTTISGNAPDYAGVTIDPNFGPANSSTGVYPYAFIQINGKASALFASAVTNGGTLAFGDIIGIKQTTGTYTTTFDDIGALGSTSATCPNAVLGYALAAPAVSTVSLVRITRPVVRF
jgi:hypothetical protein